MACISLRPRQRGVLLGMLILLVGVLWLGRVQLVSAQLSGTKSCTGPDGGSTATTGDVVTCTLTVNGSNGSTPDIPSGTSLVITSQNNNYVFTQATCSGSGGTCTVTSVGSSVITATCSGMAGASCTTLTFTETLTITSLIRERICQLVAANTTPPTSVTVCDPTFRVVAGDTLLFVSTTGDDMNNCETRIQACATINRALALADDGDTIQVLGGLYDVERTIHVDKLVIIQPDASEKVILKPRPGVTLFEVRAPGGHLLHATIRNMTLGGNY